MRNDEWKMGLSLPALSPPTAPERTPPRAGSSLELAVDSQANFARLISGREFAAQSVEICLPTLAPDRNQFLPAPREPGHTSSPCCPGYFAAREAIRRP